MQSWSILATIWSNFADIPCASGWTGPLPRQLLGEVLRRAHKQAPSPKFTKSGYPGLYRSTVKARTMGLGTRGGETIEITTPPGVALKTVEEAHSLAATLALFALVPDQPMQVRLPVPFRHVWTVLKQASMEDRRVQIRASTARRDAFIDMVLTQTPDAIAATLFENQHLECEQSDTGTCVESAMGQANRVQANNTESTVYPIRRGTNARVTDGRDKHENTSDPVESWEDHDGNSDTDNDAAPTAVLARSDAGECNAAPVGTPQLPLSAPHTPTSAHTRHDHAHTPTTETLRQILRTAARTKQGVSLRRACAELPANQCRSEILSMIASHTVSIVGGETGCGKSTQVPKMILEASISSAPIERRDGHMPCNIICTQPRRISAMSIAERVSSELGQGAPGTADTLVGYQVRMETKTSPVTRLVYCTTGILLRRLQSGTVHGNNSANHRRRSFALSRCVNIVFLLGR